MRPEVHYTGPLVCTKTKEFVSCLALISSVTLRFSTSKAIRKSIILRPILSLYRRVISSFYYGIRFRGKRTDVSNAQCKFDTEPHELAFCSTLGIDVLRLLTNSRRVELFGSRYVWIFVPRFRSKAANAVRIRGPIVPLFKRI